MLNLMIYPNNNFINIRTVHCKNIPKDYKREQQQVKLRDGQRMNKRQIEIWGHSNIVIVEKIKTCRPGKKFMTLYICL